MTDLSVTDRCQWRGGDVPQHGAFRVPALVNIAHVAKKSGAGRWLSAGTPVRSLCSHPPFKRIILKQ
jgi:hypothetical protein